MSKVDFKQWYQSLCSVDRDSYAKRAGTTRRYLEGHLIHCSKVPRGSTICNLAKATKGVFSREEMIMFFHKNGGL